MPVSFREPTVCTNGPTRRYRRFGREIVDLRSTPDAPQLRTSKEIIHTVLDVWERTQQRSIVFCFVRCFAIPIDPQTVYWTRLFDDPRHRQTIFVLPESIVYSFQPSDSVTDTIRGAPMGGVYTQALNTCTRGCTGNLEMWSMTVLPPPWRSSHSRITIEGSGPTACDVHRLQNSHPFPGRWRRSLMQECKTCEITITQKPLVPFQEETDSWITEATQRDLVIDRVCKRREDALKNEV
jgi:hypothetical protein